MAKAKPPSIIGTNAAPVDQRPLSPQGSALLANFRRMIDADRYMLVGFAGACADDRPRRRHAFTLIAGGAQ